MKRLAKQLIVSVLAWQVKRLYQKNKFKVIAVVGSAGKTSTKLAIAEVLTGKYKVQFQSGNYNDTVTVPLVFFGSENPGNLLNPISWVKLILDHEKKLKENFQYDYVVIELGTDGPDQIIEFKKYLKVDLTVLTSVAEEHMEFFKDIDAVASEEISAQEFSDEMIVSIDMVPKKYLKMINIPHDTYSIDEKSDNKATVSRMEGGEFMIELDMKQGAELRTVAHLPGKVSLYSVIAASIIAAKEGMNPEDINRQVQKIRPVSGRTNLLKGVKNSTIIDDTYNSSPASCKAALDTLYEYPGEHKIAILGNMNELGEKSGQYHAEIADYCDPKQIDLLLTVGPEANNFLATNAEKKGIKTKTFETSTEAGKYAAKQVKPESVILAKGSQNGVYAEEAVKQLLADQADAANLVRQSSYWMSRKNV